MKLYSLLLNLSSMAATTATTLPRILFIDAYDSFTNNIISLLESNLEVKVTTIKIDDSIRDFAAFLKPFVAVIAGPGPGNPQNLADVGLINKLWALDDDDLLPVIGICLGFQSLVLAFGGQVRPLPEPRHGITRRIHHLNSSLFCGIGAIETVQYHSLQASLSDIKGDKNVESLRPLAWDLKLQNTHPSGSAPQGSNPDSILMAVEHMSKPFHGIQFHPESICSNGNARKVIKGWWNVALKWHSSRLTTMKLSALLPKGRLSRKLLPASALKPSYGNKRNRAGAYSRTDHPRNQNAQKEANPQERSCISRLQRVLTEVMDLGSLKVPQVCERLGIDQGEAIVFDSETHQRLEVGNHSIIGIITPSSLKLEYTNGSPYVHITRGNGQSNYVVNLQYRESGGTIFSYLKQFIREHRAEGGMEDVPFWGGLMGYITYEACLETISVCPNAQKSIHAHRPDLSFVFIERSIVINFQQRKLYIQSLRANDELWIRQTASSINQLHSSTSTYGPLQPRSFPAAQISWPDELLYKSQIRSCQASIRAGDAYELCLTTQSAIKTPPLVNAWNLYLSLRQFNPAPFSAYVRLGPLTLISSSPERFLSWSRPQSRGPRLHVKTSTCQFRPIKGTVKRIPDDPHLAPITPEQATALLSTPKERAENLMIVDLIRHDLHGVVGSGNVRVEKLMVVEEYATLFQLVTVIEGDLLTKGTDTEGEEKENEEETPIRPLRQPSPLSSDTKSTTTTRPSPPSTNTNTGIDVLAASLPPGSMTGAPKVRACQLLQTLEGDDTPRRGIYSGVLGYLDVGGGGDFSVVIRSAFRWDRATPLTTTSTPETSKADKKATKKARDGEDEEERVDIWTIGAGGAVTTLSSEEGEWSEMRAKMESTAAIFGN